MSNQPTRWFDPSARGRYLPLVREISDTKREASDAPIDDLVTGTVEAILEAVDLNRAVQLVQEVCRIPSVLGEEGELASFLTSVMTESGFEDVQLQPVLPDRPNAVGNVSFGTGRRVVVTATPDRRTCSTMLSRREA